MPIPIAAPPGRLSISASVPTAWQSSRNVPDPPSPVTSPALDLRAAIEPLQLLPSLRSRRYEFGLGYLLRYPDTYAYRELRHGLFVEAGHYPWVEDLAEGRLRLGILASADLLLPIQGLERGAGVGGSLALGLDWSTILDDSTPVAESDGEGAFFGWAWGEVGVGVVGGVSWQHVERGDAWCLSLGLQTRIPALVGLALVPFYEFL